MFARDLAQGHGLGPPLAVADSCEAGAMYLPVGSKSVYGIIRSRGQGNMDSGVQGKYALAPAARAALCCGKGASRSIGVVAVGIRPRKQWNRREKRAPIASGEG